jgi:hypothetical protein
MYTYTMCMYTYKNKTATSIQVRKLIKGGNYQLLGGFYCGNYSREKIIQGRKLFAEIRYFEFNSMMYFEFLF